MELHILILYAHHIQIAFFFIYMLCVKKKEDKPIY